MALGIVGIASDYAELIDSLRARADQVEVSRLALDEAAGIPDGYSGKVLSKRMTKCLGLKTLGPIMQALGVCIALIEDPESKAKFSDKLPRRNEFQVRTGNSHWRNRKLPTTTQTNGTGAARV